jgi:glyoxylase-like metal-dependent hydrolase (beta-lactamase superfamily II)
MKPPRFDCTPHPGPSNVYGPVWWIGRGIWGALPQMTGEIGCNVFLLKGAKFDVLIDAGMSPTTRPLERALKLAGSAPERIREIWITHSHSDHLNGARVWTDKYPKTKVRISGIGLKFLRNKDYRLVGLSDPKRIAKYRVPKNLSAYKEGGVLTCPPWKFHVEYLPGHTLDMFCFRGRVEGVDVYFSGDCAIGDQGKTWGNIGWLNSLWLSNLRDYETSMAKLAKRIPDVLLPGHGVPHAGASAARSVKNCLKRIRKFRAFPQLGSMVPFT